MPKVSIISRHPSHRRLEFPRFDKRIRIRFGSTNDFPAKKDIEFPSKEAIKNTSSKVKMKKLFIEAEVPTPAYAFFKPSSLRKIIEDPTLLPEYAELPQLFKVEDGLLVPKFELIFKELYHSRGEGIMFINSHEDIISVIDNGKKGYVEEVVGNEREFRVHVCDGKAFYTDEKLPREEGHTARIKNMSNGYKYRNRSISRPYPLEIRGIAINAVQSLGMEFGAVDIAIDENGKINVFEVNSAMGLRTKTAKLYQEKLTELIIKKGASIL